MIIAYTYFFIYSEFILSLKAMILLLLLKEKPLFVPIYPYNVI